jgi:hypothetical protein
MNKRSNEFATFDRTMAVFLAFDRDVPGEESSV